MSSNILFKKNLRTLETHNIAIIIPAFNEDKILDHVLADLSSLNYLLIVIDDGSTDDTCQVALKYNVHLLRHICNLGQGAAIQTGINYALSFPNIQYIVTFDSDGQHLSQDIPRLIEEIKQYQCDVILGSRFLKEGLVKNINLSRKIVLKLALWLTRFTTGLLLTDTHNGLRVLTREAARKIKIYQNRMAHASEILHQISKLKLHYREAPVTVLYTSYSKAKGQSLLGAFDIIFDIIRGRF